MSSSAVSDRTVLIAGATSRSGQVAARTLADAGARVVAVGRDLARLEKVAAAVAEPASAAGPVAPPLARQASAAGESKHPAPIRLEACDLADEASVFDLADRLHTDGVHVDGVLHLVGGWRGGGGLAGQSDADFRFLEGSLTALRHVSRAFDADLNASDAARLAIVSSTSVARPLAGGANYAAVKAACEAWTRAVAQGCAKTARDAGRPLRAASVVFRVTALDGLEQELADRFVALWGADADTVNTTVIDLTA